MQQLRDIAEYAFQQREYRAFEGVLLGSSFSFGSGSSDLQVKSTTFIVDRQNGDQECGRLLQSADSILDHQILQVYRRTRLEEMVEKYQAEITARGVYGAKR